jgi:hypothetical protein
MQRSSQRALEPKALHAVLHSASSIAREVSTPYSLCETVKESALSKQARLFINGGSQAVRLPAEYRFDGEVVFVTPSSQRLEPPQKAGRFRTARCLNVAC